jgi:hypothetical protein
MIVFRKSTKIQRFSLALHPKIQRPTAAASLVAHHACKSVGTLVADIVASLLI